MAGGQREGEHRGNRGNVGGYPDTGGARQPQVGGGPRSTEGGEQDSREGWGGSLGDRWVLDTRTGDRKEYLEPGICRNGGVLYWGCGAEIWSL